MALDDCVEFVIPMPCKGIDEEGVEVLDEPIEVRVRVKKPAGSNIIYGSVENCGYSTGASKDLCRTSRPNAENPEDCPFCLYTFEVPPYEPDKKEG
jgi:hypothetical protein